MDSNRKWFIAAILVLVIAASGAGGFFLGKDVSDRANLQEQELNIKLNLSDLQGLGPIEGPIYVSGHKSPDSDTVGSSIACAALLNKLGYDAHPAIFGNINKETEYILQQAGVDIPDILEDASGCNMVLIDHSDYEHSIEGLQDANIISVIDHHGDGTVVTGNQLIYDARPLGSTATIVWIRYRNYGLTPDKQIAHVMLGSILSDTIYFESATTTEADREAVKALSAIAGVTDINAFYKGMNMALISHDGMTDEEIFYSDYKEYSAGGFNYSIACINVYEEQEAEELIPRMKSLMPGTLKSTGMDMAFTQIGIVHDGISITYLIPSDDVADDILNQAYGDIADYDGTTYVLNPGISRKKELVPAITNILEAHPKE